VSLTHYRRGDLALLGLRRIVLGFPWTSGLETFGRLDWTFCIAWIPLSLDSGTLGTFSLGLAVTSRALLLRRLLATPTPNLSPPYPFSWSCLTQGGLAPAGKEKHSHPRHFLLPGRPSIRWERDTLRQAEADAAARGTRACGTAGVAAARKVFCSP